MEGREKGERKVGNKGKEREGKVRGRLHLHDPRF